LEFASLKGGVAVFDENLDQYHAAKFLTNLRLSLSAMGWRQKAVLKFQF